MPFPEDSSHFCDWIWSDEEIKEQRNNIRIQAEDRIKQRLQEAGVSSIASIKFPTQQECDNLVSYFISQLIFVCAEKRLEYRVTTTAATYFSRFYVRRSILEYDPRRILLTCILLAAKVEESMAISLRHFCDGLISTKEHLAEVLDSELVVLEALSFQLLVLNARAPIHYLTTQYYQEKKFQHTSNNEELTTLSNQLTDLNRQAEQLALKAHSSGDIIFQYSPAQIAVAAFLHAASTSLSDAESFVESQFTKHPESYHMLRNPNQLIFREIRLRLAMMMEDKLKQSDEERAQKAFKIIKKMDKINKLLPKIGLTQLKKDKIKRSMQISTIESQQNEQEVSSSTDTKALTATSNLSEDNPMQNDTVSDGANVIAINQGIDSLMDESCGASHHKNDNNFCVTNTFEDNLIPENISVPKFPQENSLSPVSSNSSNVVIEPPYKKQCYSNDN